jgi:hypothetical protein
MNHLADSNEQRLSYHNGAGSPDQTFAEVLNQPWTLEEPEREDADEGVGLGVAERAQPEVPWLKYDTGRGIHAGRYGEDHD